jgi:hypothetical protein
MLERMRKQLATLVLSAASMTAVAQSTTGSVLCGGNNHSNGSASLSYTVGDLCVKTLLADGVTLGQGALSGTVSNSGIAVNAGNMVVAGIQVYPNPTADILQVDLGPLATDGIRLRICDAAGRVVTSEAFPSGPSRAQVSTGALSSGTFVLSIARGDQVLATYRIIKD